VIVENAHEALITEEDAERIIEVRSGRACKKFTRTSNRTHNSRYLLSGGLFKCERCGSNMIGYRNSSEGIYYICGSQPYRRGMGCGPGVYVPKQAVEDEVLSGLRDLVGVCGDPNGFVRMVNQELKRIWQESVGYDPSVPTRVKEIENKIANIRKAVEDGLPDSQWAYTRMRELMGELDGLREKQVVTHEPAKIDVATALAYRKQTEKLLAAGSDTERKRMMKLWVDKVSLAPESLEVEITYKLPPSIVNSDGEGPRSHCIHQWLQVSCR
jgi:hypothetical protein